MTRQVSIGVKVDQLHGLLGTKDVNDWEAEFIQSVWDRSGQGSDTRPLTDKQIAVIDRIWREHFT